jgi:hypothetical protein
MGERVDGRARTLLALLTLVALDVGVWAEFGPRSFYRSFPGLGRHWVSALGPYNEHLIRDVGSLNLALAVVSAAAAILGTVVLTRTAALAWLVYSVPHLVFHLANLGPFGGGDQIGSVTALALSVLLPIMLLALTVGPAVRTGAGAAARG